MSIVSDGRGKKRTKPKPNRGTKADKRLKGRGRKPGPKPKKS